MALIAGMGSSCATHVQGIVRPGPAGATLQMREGTELRLVLTGPATPLGRLDGHIAEVWGRRVFRTLTVSDWKVHEGLHGMPAWVGPLEPMGAQLGIQDRNSGAFYWLDPAATRTLAPHAGEVVLVEGYVDGPHRIRVLYFRLLEPQG